MKKLLTVILVTSIALGLAACKREGSAPNQTTPSNNQDVGTTSAAPAPAATTPSVPSSNATTTTSSTNNAQ